MLVHVTASTETPLYIYTLQVPFIAVKSTNEINPHLNITLYDTFGDDFDIDHPDHEPFCGFVWVKVVFFSAFAASHFSMGFLADYFGHWKMMKLATKGLIVFGIGVTLSSKFLF